MVSGYDSHKQGLILFIFVEWAFVTSEHTNEQLDKGADIILRAADKYNFLIG